MESELKRVNTSAFERDSALMPVHKHACLRAAILHFYVHASKPTSTTRDRKGRCMASGGKTRCVTKLRRVRAKGDTARVASIFWRVRVGHA
eukprot:3433696-Pleurochrysis_carterae.AAC.1